MDWPIGMIIPPPTPWSTRNTMRLCTDHEAPERTDPTQEHGERHDPHPLGAEMLDRPPGQGNDRRQGEQVAGAHPLDGRQRGPEVPRQRGDGHVDDGGVEDRHDGPDDHHRGQTPQVWVELGESAGAGVAGVTAGAGSRERGEHPVHEAARVVGRVGRRQGHRFVEDHRGRDAVATSSSSATARRSTLRSTTAIRSSSQPMARLPDEVVDLRPVRADRTDQLDGEGVRSHRQTGERPRWLPRL